MCCFRLHFSGFIVLFFKKNKKNLLRFTFEKNNLLCKKREKNNLSQGKIPAPPPRISNGPSLIVVMALSCCKGLAGDTNTYVYAGCVSFQRK